MPSKSKSSSSSEMEAVETISNVITVSDFDGLPMMLDEEERNVILNTIENYLININATNGIQNNELDGLHQVAPSSVIHEGYDSDEVA